MNRNLVVIITLLFALSSFSNGERLAERPMKKVESKKVNSNQLKKVKKQPRKVKGVLPSFSKSEIELIDKAIAGKFANLSSKDKENLINILKSVKGTDDKSLKSKSNNTRNKKQVRRSK